jgi:hypothetical protein
VYIALLNGLGYNMSMNNEVRKYLSTIGKKGGSSKSPKKVKSSLNNLIKANAKKSKSKI